MIDTHCHLTDPRLHEQLPSVLARAAANGIHQMLTVGTSPDDARAAVELARTAPNVFAIVGIHPNYSQAVQLADVAALRSIQAHEKVVALGEMGLDYFHDRASRQQQHLIFQAQLQLASELDRPVVIHAREAIDDTLAVMTHFPRVRAVFHCFTGTPAEASRILAAGYLLGFDGPITYKKNDELRRIVADVPPDRLLVETDAPYLTPEPMRKQKVNEPALVKHVAEKMAEIKGWSIEQVDEITTANARRFFQLPVT